MRSTAMKILLLCSSFFIFVGCAVGLEKPLLKPALDKKVYKLSFIEEVFGGEKTSSKSAPPPIDPCATCKDKCISYGYSVFYFENDSCFCALHSRSDDMDPDLTSVCERTPALNVPTDTSASACSTRCRLEGRTSFSYVNGECTCAEH